MKPRRPLTLASLALRRELRYVALAFATILTVGAFGFRHIGGGATTLFDGFYMTFITVATIGYGEIVDLSQHPWGRLFNVGIAVSGIGAWTYMFSIITAVLVERSLDPERRRQRMVKAIDKLHGHYIVCGMGRVGGNVARELNATRHAHVAVDDAQEALERHIERMREIGHEPYAIQGDGADDDTLIEAGIKHAAGLFAVTGEDAKNMVIVLTAKQLNPKLRVVARVHDVRNIEKCRRVGADEIVSPDFTGGLRIASAMLRPHAVNFMDQMLRRSDALRVEEITLPATLPTVALGTLAPPSRDYVVVALREANAPRVHPLLAQGDQWQFSPPVEQDVAGGQVLIVIATPLGREAIEQRVAELAAA
ncbi:potassium channel family protein [Derxia gummosa]|uniref:Potassium channel family protein n=1 Tax=Derxia gummosa DSM 723 TaxID=1121388 RepID=A0A8B6XB67_9BURK|nr:potassium channel family protein [Derxia gummosa]